MTRYHNNLESCADFFPRLCSTHGQKGKCATLKIAAEAELFLCSRGIIGLGETPVHRIDLALELRKLKISSIPLNVLMPIPGTPLGKNPLPAPEEILRTLTLFRFILPQSRIRLGGEEKPWEQAFLKPFSAAPTDS